MNIIYETIKCHSVDVNVFSCNDNTSSVIKMRDFKTKAIWTGDFNPDALVHIFFFFG